MRNPGMTVVWALAVIVAGVEYAAAEVKMPAIFGDHMVLQQGKELPVWGTAEAGEKVTVAVGGETGAATADADGKWMVKLAALPAGSRPLTMTVTGKNVLTFTDVLPGDVWICSGQSNMEFGLGNVWNAKEEIPKADLPLVRLFLVPKKISLVPLTDVSLVPGNALEGHWQICTPATVIKVGGWNGFSAVGYYFGREIQKVTGRPVGLIGTYWGGTPAESWTSLPALEKEPALQPFAERFKKTQADLAQATADYPAKMAAFKAALAKWNDEVGTPLKASMQEWKDASAKAVAAGQPAPPKPVASVPPPMEPVTPDGGSHTPTGLFNGMVAPIIPYAITGTIWYQGESNAGMGSGYRALFGAMITDWRQHWGEGDFPFLFVQLAKYGGPSENWALLREAQLKTLALPNTGMALAYDIGDEKDIHPKDKLDVGERLALAARHVAYGEQLVYSGPIYDKMQAQGGAIRVSFTQEGSGLVIGKAPWVTAGGTPIPDTSLVGFTIAGEDRKWVPAEAKIDGDAVVVSSAEVPQPVAVRYAFLDATGNLYNKEGLPASPFRTDDWAPKPPAPAPAPAPVAK